MEFQSIIKRTRKQKMKALAAALAINIAKEKHDPNYENYHSFREKFIALRRNIFNRYKREAMFRARMAVKKSALKQFSSNNKG